jgi:demethylmenaquinone methyltransferase/2-methoxy-6-polyprenyl-1,4-benzoquinol methylase
MSHDIYDPDFVAGVFDRCAANYRRWSAVASFGFISRWRRLCVRDLPDPSPDTPHIIDLMAGTGEIWPYLLARFPKARITAIDISTRMHDEAVARLHASRADRITHIAANALTHDLPEETGDVVVSSFGLKTFNADQHIRLASQIARVLKPGGTFSLIEASDPVGWRLRPLYRLYLDHILPLIERAFLKGAQDFTMLGTYTRNFSDCTGMAAALRDAGLTVSMTRDMFGCATGVVGRKPMA